ncbi:hypothetical protein [Nostoc sp. UCD121]|uniref:hypothetical protein n=1 Tax=Nostoc sp. UCD121 TaxID=2681305 RepID=UPI00162360E0|nr:hypothetical protein [Nostoc sp. UCD121]MBC1225134.1 hypothetical protein [Nostoc sp. UCD120]
MWEDGEDGEEIWLPTLPTLKSQLNQGFALILVPFDSDLQLQRLTTKSTIWWDLKTIYSALD